MKKLLLFLTLFTLTIFVKAQTPVVTPQFKRNIPVDHLLGYSFPGLTGNYWLPDTAWLNTNYIKNTTVLQHANLTIDQTATANAFVAKGMTATGINANGLGNGGFGVNGLLVTTDQQFTANGQTLYGAKLAGTSSNNGAVGTVTWSGPTIGSGYTDGTYTGVTLKNITRLNGVNPTATVIVTGGTVTSVTFPTGQGGARNQIGDVLNLNNPTAIGPGTGFAVSVQTVVGYTGDLFYSAGFFTSPAVYVNVNDATILSTPQALVTMHVLDSVAAAGGLGVTSVASGYGLSGGPITSTGTLFADTTILKSKVGFLTDYNNLSTRISAIPTYTASNGVIKTGSNFTSDTTFNQTVLNFFPKGDTRYLRSSVASSTYASLAGSNVFTGTTNTFVNTVASQYSSASGTSTSQITGSAIGQTNTASVGTMGFLNSSQLSYSYNTNTSAVNSFLFAAAQSSGASNIITGNPVQFKTNQLQIVSTISTNPRGFLNDQYSTDAVGAKDFDRKARGTFASPTTIITGDVLGGKEVDGYDGTNFVPAAKILVTSIGAVSLGIVPSTMALQTASQTGALTTAILIDQAQNVNLPVNNNITMGDAAGIYMGTGTNPNSGGAVVLMRSLTTGTSNVHGFDEFSVVNRSGIGANGITVGTTLTGTNSYSHLNGYQFYPTISATGTTTYVDGMDDAPAISNGIVTNRIGVSIQDAIVTGGGSIGTEFGIRIHGLVAGTTNYAIYTDGPTRSYLGGTVQVGYASPITPAFALDVYGAIRGSSFTNSTQVLLGGTFSSGYGGLEILGGTPYSELQSIQQGVGYTNIVMQRLGGLTGIATATPGSALQVNGGISVGYSASTAAPTNGMIINGVVNMISPFSLNSVAGTALQIPQITSGGTTMGWVLPATATNGVINILASTQTTLVAGTKALSVTGVTTSSHAYVTLVSASGTSLTTQYQAVCTSGTVTLQANIAAGTINTSDVSIINVFVTQ